MLAIVLLLLLLVTVRSTSTRQGHLPRFRRGCDQLLQAAHHALQRGARPLRLALQVQHAVACTGVRVARQKWLRLVAATVVIHVRHL